MVKIRHSDHHNDPIIINFDSLEEAVEYIADHDSRGFGVAKENAVKEVRQSLNEYGSYENCDGWELVTAESIRHEISDLINHANELERHLKGLEEDEEDG